MKNLALILAAFSSLAADPSAFEARKIAIRALLDRQDFAAALGQAKALNREWPDDIAGYQLLAAAQLGLGDYTGAESSMQWMLDLRIGKTDAQGWLLIARLREETGDLEGALDAVNQAYGRLAPTEVKPREALLVYSARLECAAGRLEQAERLLHDALAAVPGDEAALEALARLRTAQHRRAEASEILRRLTHGDADPRVLYQLAEATGDPADYAAFERAARPRMTRTDNANRELALYYAGPGRQPAAAEKIARLESARRRDIFTLDALAVALDANGKSAEARACIEQVLALGTRDAAILQHAARIGAPPK